MFNKTCAFTQAVKYQPLPPTTSKPHSQENAYFDEVIDAADQTCSNTVVNQSLAVTCVRAARRQGAKFRFKLISIFSLFLRLLDARQTEPFIKLYSSAKSHRSILPFLSHQAQF